MKIKMAAILTRHFVIFIGHIIVFKTFHIVLQNVSGTFTAIISIISLAAAPNARTAAIYYFITALFVLLACFDTYFALPLNVSMSVTYPLTCTQNSELCAKKKLL